MAGLAVAGGRAGGGALLIALLSWRPGRLPLLLIFLLADLLLPLLLWGPAGGGTAGSERFSAGPHLAGKRPVAGAGAVPAAGQRCHSSSDHPALWRWLLNAQIWLLPALLLGSAR
jgi:osmoprotectant transport system permease protein